MREGSGPVLPGVIGLLLHYEALRASFTELKLIRNPGCRYCGEQAEFPGYVEYQISHAQR